MHRLLFLFALPLLGADSWHASLVVVGAGQAVDLATSFRAYEKNPLLRGADGRLGQRGTALKVGVVGASVLAQRLILRRHPRFRKLFTWMNLGNGAVSGAVAVHNLTVERIPR